MHFYQLSGGLGAREDMHPCSKSCRRKKCMHWIRLFCKGLVLLGSVVVPDPDPHQSIKQDPGPHRSDADPQHCFLVSWSGSLVHVRKRTFVWPGTYSDVRYDSTKHLATSQPKLSYATTESKISRFRNGPSKHSIVRHASTLYNHIKLYLRLCLGTRIHTFFHIENLLIRDVLHKGADSPISFQ